MRTQFDGHNDLYNVFNEEKGMAIGDTYTTEHQAGLYGVGAHVCM
jgi:hypothetical protein